MTIGKFFDNFEKLGFSAAEIDAANDRMVKRAFFRVGKVFGGAKDTEGGRWEAKKVAFVLFKDPVTKKLVSLEDERLQALVASLGAPLEQGKPYEVDGKTLRLEVKTLVWQPCYTIGGAIKDGLSKSFLLNTSATDADNRIVKYQSDIHEWANANIVDRVLDREWATKLAGLLNEKGLVFDEVEYPRKRNDGSGTFTAKVLNPFFADTHTA